MTNRITPYESGWLGMLVKQGICTPEEAREAIADLERRRAAKRERKRKRREE